MAASPHTLEMLWQRLEDAKLQLQFALNYLKEIHEDKLSGDIPGPDGYYALRNALRGEEQAIMRYLRALHDLKAALVLEQGPNGASHDAATDEAAEAAITPREREVLSFIAAGKTSKEIAAELGISFRTTVCHRYRLYQKLRVHSNVELMRVALRMGLVEL